MTYNSADLVLVDQPASGVQNWMYTSVDPALTVLAANYISDARDRGMLPGDIVTIRVASAESPYGQIVTIANIVEATVMSVSAAGAVLSTVPQAFIGDSSSGGVAGAVPSPAAGDAAARKVLGAGGDWKTPSYLVAGQNLDNVARLGIGTTDTGNVLSVSGATSLFSNSGDCRVSMSKGAVGDTVAFNFQNNFSTRVQFGLLGNDSFTVATSADGSAFNNAIVATTDGAVSFPNTGGFTGDSGSGGGAGLVPAPAAGDAAGGKFLKASGAWAQPAASDVSGLATVATSGSYADLSNQPTLGTAAALDVPASGDASTSQVVKGDDTRLTDSRTPAAHASSHASGQSDALSLSASQISGIPASLASKNLDSIARLGIGTTDTGNVLSVSGATSLFSNSSGGVQVTLSKNGSGDTASFLFGANFSNRAEFGLCGDDNFTVKVSPDGSAWNSAIVIDKTTAAVSISKSLKVAVVTYANLPASPSEGEEINVSDATVNTWGATISAGSGSYHVKARYNGSAWTVVGI